MDVNSRRVSSAGYRVGLPRTTEPPADSTRSGKAAAVSAEQTDRRDPVRQDQLYKDTVCRERRAVHQWEKNWGFLRNYDQMGQSKPEEPLPSHVSLFSDRVPKTSNQVFGSRLSTPLGRELIRLDQLSLWNGGAHRCKQDPEMLPY